MRFLFFILQKVFGALEMPIRDGTLLIIGGLKNWFDRETIIKEYVKTVLFSFISTPTT